MRLELTRATDLALRALAILDEDEGRIKRSALAEAIGTTPDFVARVMGRLVAAGWVSSEPGRYGGYVLTAPAGSFSVLDVIRVVEGVPADGVCVLRGGPCGGADLCAVHDAWGRAREALTKELAETPAIKTRSG